LANSYGIQDNNSTLDAFPLVFVCFPFPTLKNIHFHQSDVGSPDTETCFGTQIMECNKTRVQKNVRVIRVYIDIYIYIFVVKWNVARERN